MDSERRQFQRVSFDTIANLSKDDQTFACQIIDLSIHGVLLRTHGVVHSKVGAVYNLEIPLSDHQITIKMTLKLTHQHPENLGFVCQNIDLDSITHLRKIIEMNSGDATLLDREFSCLLDS